MSSPTPPKNEPKELFKLKELSNEVRMVIAFVLMGLILVVTPWAYRKLGITPPPSADSKTSAIQTSSGKKPDPAASTAPMLAPATSVCGMSAFKMSAELPSAAELGSW